MVDTPIAKVRVTHVEEITLPERDGLPIKTVVASKLLVSNLRPNNDPRMVEHGTMVVPIQLPFGRNFLLILREDDGTVQAPLGRQFREHE